MKLNSFTLSQCGLLNRIPPRPEEHRQENYLELYDDETLFYDIFYSGNKLIFLSPPIDDVEWRKVLKNITIDNEVISLGNVEFYSTNKVYKLIFFVEHIPEVRVFGKLVMNLSRYEGEVSHNDRVLYTTQKNNSIHWIVDWANWHIEHHSVNTVVIYDNNSDAYKLSEIKGELNHRIKCKVLLFSMPFKYGPGDYKFNGMWDSDYYQYFAFEHVRYAVCQSRTKLLNMDIDELAINRSGESIFDEVNKDSSIVFFRGRWIAVEDNHYAKDVSHKLHDLLDISNHISVGNKWAVNLLGLNDDVFLQVHNTKGRIVNVKQLTGFHYLHFRSINTGWKNTIRGVYPAFDSKKFKRINLHNYQGLFETIPK